MKKYAKVIGVVFLVIVGLLIIFFFLFLRPIEKQGTINTSSGKVSSQIRKAVGWREVGAYQHLLDLIKYPNINQYTLKRDRAIPDHDWRTISFSTNDSFDNVVSYYQNNLPNEKPLIETTGGETDAYQCKSDTDCAWKKIYVDPYKTAQFRWQPEAGKRPFIRIDITEQPKENNTSIYVTEDL